MTFGQFARLMQERADTIKDEMRTATQKATDLVHAESKRIMNEGIYSKPIDVGMYKRGKGGAYVSVTDAAGKSHRRSVGFTGGFPSVEINEGDTVGAGKPKWRRTGNLRNSEKSKVLSAYEGAVDNSAGYALARHNLGFGPSSPEAIDPKPKQKRNTTRQAPFRTKAIEATRQGRFDVYHQSLQFALFR
jgi:hypothetical protein